MAAGRTNSEIAKALGITVAINMGITLAIDIGDAGVVEGLRMAKIKGFRDLNGEPGASRTELTCSHRGFEAGGERLLYLATAGSEARAEPGQMSHVLLFDETSARRLISIIEGALPGIRRG